MYNYQTGGVRGTWSQRERVQESRRIIPHNPTLSTFSLVSFLEEENAVTRLTYKLYVDTAPCRCRLYRDSLVMTQYIQVADGNT